MANNKMDVPAWAEKHRVYFAINRVKSGDDLLYRTALRTNDDKLLLTEWLTSDGLFTFIRENRTKLESLIAKHYAANPYQGDDASKPEFTRAEKLILENQLALMWALSQNLTISTWSVIDQIDATEMALGIENRVTKDWLKNRKTSR